MSDKPTPLSTSALAKALAKSTKQMFAELESLSWIKRDKDSWVLTPKGEFEGGRYRESHKFGRYIIWPSDTVRHNALVSADAHLLSTADIGKAFSLSRRRVELILQEIGWMTPGRKGWLLTALGEAVGGSQRENSATGVPYVMWPDGLVDNAVLIDRVVGLEKGGDDAAHLLCCDGHQVRCEAERHIDNWLYLSGLLHAYGRPLPCDEKLTADFYLPQHQLYIEYWGKENSQGTVSAKMKKKEKFISMGVNLIELNDEDVLNLDETLPRMLLKYNIET